MKKIIPISLIVIFLDQITKIIISNLINVNTSIKVINNFFSITLTHNIGAAFSILKGSRVILILVSIIILIIIYKFLIKQKNLNSIETLAYGLLIGGIIGNLIDRILYGYVIDFLDFIIFNYNFAIFNIADASIVISVLLLFVLMIKGEKNGSKS